MRDVFSMFFSPPNLFPNIFELQPPPRNISLPNPKKIIPNSPENPGYLRFEAPFQQFTELWNGIANLTACFLWNRNMHQCTCTRWREDIGKTWNKWVTLGDYLSQIYRHVSFTNLHRPEILFFFGDAIMTWGRCKNINKNPQRSWYIAWLLQRTLNDKYAVFKVYVWCIKKSKCNEKHIQKTLRTRKHHRKKKAVLGPDTVVDDSRLVLIVYKSTPSHMRSGSIVMSQMVILLVDCRHLLHSPGQYLRYSSTARPTLAQLLNVQ